MNFIIRREVHVCTDVVLQDVSVDRWPAHVRIRWEQISGVNRTSATTTIEVGVKRDAEIYGFRSGPAVALNRSVRMHGELFLSGEYRPTARFRGATLGDMLELNCAGVIIDEA